MFSKYILSEVEEQSNEKLADESLTQLLVRLSSWFWETLMQLKSGFKEILNSEDPPIKVPLFVDVSP